MDTSKADNWYEEEKQKLFEDYMASLDNRSDEEKDELGVKFKRSMEDALRKYEKMVSKLNKPNRTKEFFRRIHDKLILIMGERMVRR